MDWISKTGWFFNFILQILQARGSQNSKPYIVVQSPYQWCGMEIVILATWEGAAEEEDAAEDDASAAALTPVAFALSGAVVAPLLIPELLGPGLLTPTFRTLKQTEPGTLTKYIREYEVYFYLNLKKHPTRRISDNAFQNVRPECGRTLIDII